MTRICMVLFLFMYLTSVANAADDWVQQSPDPSPTSRDGHAMAYIGGDQVLLFGGENTPTLPEDTWVYDLSATTWTQKSPASNPSPRYYHAMAYIGDDQVLLFGGFDANGRDDETWVYDLSADTWTQQSPTSSPSARRGHKIDYIGGDQVLLFGGYDGAPDGETWVYDLSEDTWTQQSPSTSPSARYNYSMAYIGDDQVLLFGGRLSTGWDDETWVYDLSEDDWTQQSPPSSPSPRDEHAMALMGEGQVLLFGGWDPDPWTYDGETWVYDLNNDTWTEDTNTTQPSARYRHAISETSMDGFSYPVLFGGYDASGFDGETWTFGGGDYPSGLDAMVLYIDLINVNTARISWSAVTDATDYDLYRSTSAFFTGSGPPWQTVAAPTTQLDFSDGIGDTNTNYFFLGKARNATQSSSESNIVGEVDYITEDGE